MTFRAVSYCLVVISIGVPLAAQTQFDRTLRGLSEFSITIENLSPTANTIGITRANLRRDVELKLRLAGIRIVPESLPRLYINLRVLLSPIRTLYAYRLDINVQQDLDLSDGRRFPGVTTWHKGMVGTAGNEVVKEAIYDALKEEMDDFLNAYLTVNPRSR